MNRSSISRGKYGFFEKKFVIFQLLGLPETAIFMVVRRLLLHTYTGVSCFFPSQAVFRFFTGQISDFSFFIPLFAPFLTSHCVHAFLSVYLQARKRGLSGPCFRWISISCIYSGGSPLYLVFHFLILGIKVIDLFLQRVVAPGRFRGGLRVLPGLRIRQLRLQGGGVRLRL